jgi:DNA-binding transcriptional ArsR family regulator
MRPQAKPRSKATHDIGIAQLERKATEAAGLLKLLANENRLLILCRLVIAGEMSVGDLAEAVELSQSALSQHLAKMREDGLVATRRDACLHCSRTSTAPDQANQRKKEKYRDKSTNHFANSRC